MKLTWKENNMPVTATRKEYFCEHCNKMYVNLESCIEHESTCLDEQGKYADIKKRMVDIDKHNLILFYAKSPEEIDDYVFGCAEDYEYERFEYPSLVVIQKYKELDYEGGYDTFFIVTEFDQYIHEINVEKNRLVNRLGMNF